MKNQYDVIIFSAHPDDAEMAMGGTMTALAKSAKSVLHVSLTRGEMGTFGTTAERLAEFEEAARIIGCGCVALDFPDTGVENDQRARTRIAGLIRTYKPEIVFAPYHTNPAGERGGIAHVDHATTGSLVRDAVKIARLSRAVADSMPHVVRKLYFYMLPSLVQPKIVVDVSDEMETALRAIEAYRSQLAISPNSLPIRQLLVVKRAALGADIGVAYAEGFTTDLPLVFKAGDFFRT